MAISPVRLNHAVLFVADLDRSVGFYTEVFDMEVIASEPRANAAFLRLPRSGNHHDLGLFGVGDYAAARSGAAQSGCTTWRGSSTRSTNSPRPPGAARGGCLPGESTTAPPRASTGRPRWQRVRADVAGPPQPTGASTTGPRREPLDLAGEVDRWSGVSTAHPS